MQTTIYRLIFIFCVSQVFSTHISAAPVIGKLSGECKSVIDLGYSQYLTDLNVLSPTSKSDENDKLVNSISYIELCNEALRSKPLSKLYKYYLAVAHHREGEYQKALSIYERLAYEGHPESQYALATMLVRHADKVKTKLNALAWLIKAAEQEHTNAQRALAEVYLYGDFGVNQDDEKWLYWLKRAAHLNDWAAQYRLGRYYLDLGKDLSERNSMYKEATYWLLLTMLNNAPFLNGYRELDIIAFSGEDFDVIIDINTTSLEQSARNGQGKAAWLLGTMYLMGWGVSIDYERAANWYHKAGDNGFKLSEDTNKWLHHYSVDYGLGTNELRLRNERYALEGDTLRSALIGHSYREGGRGYSINYQKAFEWFSHVLDNDTSSWAYLIAAYELGMMYKEGQGVEKDLILAQKYFATAAENGHTEALYELGNILHDINSNDLIVLNDNLKVTFQEGAIIYWAMAAKKGHAYSYARVSEYFLSIGNYSEALSKAKLGMESYYAFQKSALQNQNKYNVDPFYQQFKKHFIRLVRIVSLLEQHEQDKNFPLAFQALQLAHNPARSDTIKYMASKLSTNNHPTKNRIIEIQKRVMKNRYNQTAINDLNEQKLKLGDKSPLTQDKIDSIYLSKTFINGEINKLYNRVLKDFPEYLNINDRKPLIPQAVQDLLHPKEAVLAYLIDKDESYLLVIKKGGLGHIIKLSISEQEIIEHVTAIRNSLVPSGFGKNTNIPLFNVEDSHYLYKNLLEPAVQYLKGIDSLVIVADGPLNKLPFNVLINEPSINNDAEIDYSSLNWIIKHFSLSTVPSISALVHLRKRTRSILPDNEFIGFGDPLLSDDNSNYFALQQLNISDYFSRGYADAEKLREMPRLPDTAAELKAIDDLLPNKSKNRLYLGDSASEATVKLLNLNGQLSKYNILAFATHGLLASEAYSITNGHPEAGLVLTPPDNPSINDDGLLTASEITNLDLNADLVILSACNTGTLEGDDSSGLSDLVESFIYAGSRSVFASQWYVDSYATKVLVSDMVRHLKANSTISKARALQHSMLTMINACDWRCKLGLRSNKYAHPIYWAPFSIIGE